MKLIALKDFVNNFGVELDRAVHARMVHKGARFEIGTAQELKKLPAAERLLVAQLTVAHCVGDATDAKVVKAVEEEVALDKKRDENAVKLNAAADASKLVEQLTALLQKANAAAAPAPAK